MLTQAVSFGGLATICTGQTIKDSLRLTIDHSPPYICPCTVCLCRPPMCSPRPSVWEVSPQFVQSRTLQTHSGSDICVQAGRAETVVPRGCQVILWEVLEHLAGDCLDTRPHKKAVICKIGFTYICFFLQQTWCCQIRPSISNVIR